MRTFPDLTVEQVFESWPEPHRSLLLEARNLVLEVASGDPRIGPLSETLKWGQPSYITEATGAGTAVRLGRIGEHHSALFVHCQTTLVHTYRQHFPELTYSGSRAIVLNPEEPLPSTPLAMCIELALTYKLRRGTDART
jgi:hypothetical protein